MAFKINIQNKVISFPDTSESPNWAPAVVAFAQAVEEALAAFTGGYDVAPQIQNIDAHNPGTDIDIDSLLFPPSEVLFVEVGYTVYRETDSISVIEGGKLYLTYDANRSPTEKWDIVRVTHAGDASITFSCSDTGQVKFTTTSIAGSGHTGFISFRALSILKP